MNVNFDTTQGATSDERVGIMTALKDQHLGCRWPCSLMCWDVYSYCDMITKFGYGVVVEPILKN